MTDIAQPTPSDATDALSRHRRNALLRRLVVIPLTLYLIWCGLLFFQQEKLIFPTHIAGPKMSERAIPPEVERVWLQVKTPFEGRPPRVEAWFLAAKHASVDAPAPLAVYFHGNGELIDHCLDAVAIYRERGYHVLIPEYRGYGRSVGRPSQRVIVEDALAQIEMALARPGASAEGLVYHGRSLGSGVAAQVALQRAPAALILESPFTSIASFATSYGVPGFLVRSPFRTDKALPLIEPRPRTLILHSRDDEIVPYEHGLRLREIAPWAEAYDMTGSHLVALRSVPGAWKAIERTLDGGE